MSLKYPLKSCTTDSFLPRAELLESLYALVYYVVQMLALGLVITERIYLFFCFTILFEVLLLLVNFIIYNYSFVFKTLQEDLKLKACEACIYYTVYFIRLYIYAIRGYDRFTNT